MRNLFWLSLIILVWAIFLERFSPYEVLPCAVYQKIATEQQGGDDGTKL